jgi:hypothetical protein
VNKVCGTVKAAKLEGNPNFSYLIATSIYDTKPVHYFSMISEQVKWMVKENDAYNKERKRMEPL